MKKVLILGGGFAGVAAAHALIDHGLSGYQITLIDSRAFHLFTPSLYEAATSETPLKNIAIPFGQIFGNKVDVVKGKVDLIDPTKMEVTISDGRKLTYDYLVLSVGSETAYYGIPGLKEYAIPLKSVEDAVKIKDKIKDTCCREGECKRHVQVVIGGGGFSGTELAAELLTYKDRLAAQHHLEKDCLEVSIIQGSDRLLNELDTHVSNIAQKRMNNPQIHFCFGGHIKEVNEKEVLTDDGKSYPYDILIWTGGIKSNELLEKNKFAVNKRGQVPVDEFLRVKGYENIFAAGDNSEYLDKSEKPAPTVAQVAEEEGACVGDNIYRLIKGKSLVPYKYRHFGYIVPLHGRFVAAELMGFLHIDGFLGWVMQQGVFLRYLVGILSLPKALIRWNKFESELKQ